MLKFTTITPFDINSPLSVLAKTKPLIEIDNSCHLISGKIKGLDAKIIGRALELAGFSLPCFYDGDIRELDKKDSQIIMVLPSGEYPIVTKLNEQRVYLLDLKDITIK